MTEKKTITHLDLTKLTKILTKKKFNASFVSFQQEYGQYKNFQFFLKTFGQYKKLPLDKLARKKDIVVQEMFFFTITRFR